jgi:hypothetical protein
MARVARALTFALCLPIELVSRTVRTAHAELDLLAEDDARLQAEGNPKWS